MTLCPGETATATVAIYNSGSRGWVLAGAAQTAYLGTWNPSPGQDQPTTFGGDGQWDSPRTGWPRYNRVAVQPADYVGPNQVAWFQFPVLAPMAPGSYRFYIRPLVEGAQWMEDFGIYWQITVPGELETSGWTRGIFLQAQVPANGFTAENTILVQALRTGERAHLYPQIAWLFTGPYSPDGTAVIAGDRTGHSYVIWPQLLTTLPTGTFWTWTDPDTVSGVAPTAGSTPERPAFELLRANARTGEVVQRRPVSTEYGTVSPRGDWISISTSVPDFVGEAITVSLSGTRVSSGPKTRPAGWLPDGRVVFIRGAGGASNVEARDPSRTDATVVGSFGDVIDALAQPTSNVIAVVDHRTNMLWAIRGTTMTQVPLQTPLSEITLESLSRDGRTLSFSTGSGGTSRTGVVDLVTGAVTFMCTSGCWRLVVN